MVNKGQCATACVLSHVQFFGTPQTLARQAPLSMGLSQQEYWSGLPFPPPGDLLHPGIELASPVLQADSLPSEPPRKPTCWSSLFIGHQEQSIRSRSYGQRVRPSVSCQSQMDAVKGREISRKRYGSSIKQSSLCSQHRNNPHFTLCIFILTTEIKKRQLCWYNIIQEINRQFRMKIKNYSFLLILRLLFSLILAFVVTLIAFLEAC